MQSPNSLSVSPLCPTLLLFSSDVFLPFQVKKLLLKSRLVKCFNRYCQDLFCLPCLPPAWGICLPCPWLVNTIFTLVPYLLFKTVSAHYFPGDVLKFIGSEVREPAVLFEIHGHAPAAAPRA